MGYKYFYLNLHVIVFEDHNASVLKSETVTLRYKRSFPALLHCPPLLLRVDCIISVTEENLFKAENTSLC